MLTTENKEALAKNIRRQMLETGINARELAKVIGVSYTALLSWINATNYPRIDKIEKLSQHFGVSKGELVEGNPLSVQPGGIRRSPNAITIDLCDELSAKLRMLAALHNEEPSDYASKLVQKQVEAWEKEHGSLPTF